MQRNKRYVIRLSETEIFDGEIVFDEQKMAPERDIVQKYLDGELSQEMRSAVILAARISRGLLDAFDRIDVSWIGDAIMKMATALGKPLPVELCVPDISKHFHRPALNAIYHAVGQGKLTLEDEHELDEN